MDILQINNPLDEALTPYMRLTEAQLLNRLHPENGIFICESIKVIRVALEHGLEPMSFLCEEKFIDTHIRQLSPKVPVYTASREILRQITGYELSRGILCAMRRPQLPTADQILSASKRVAILDAVVNSENTGSIFRSAAALGIDAVLLTRTCCDPLVRRACRVSMGTVFQVPWTFLDSYNSLKDNNFAIVAMALANNSINISDPVLKKQHKIAIVLGAEGDGLPDNVLSQADFVAKIPMHNGVDSLNVAAASAVVFWELAKH